MTKGLENGIVGNLTFVSANNKIGHSFFVYKSYINDILDFFGFSYGYTWGDWKLIKANQYNIIANNYISIKCTVIAKEIEINADSVNFNIIQFNTDSTKSLSRFQLFLADIFYDNKVNIADLIIMKKKILGII